MRLMPVVFMLYLTVLLACGGSQNRTPANTDETPVSTVTPIAVPISTPAPVPTPSTLPTPEPEPTPISTPTPTPAPIATPTPSDGIDDEIGTGKGIAGAAGVQTEVWKDTDGAPYGYLEYIPQNFNAQDDTKWPVIVFWAGSSNVARGGTYNLDTLLDEGIPNLIQAGRHFDAFVFSPQLPSTDDFYVDKSPFFDYFMTRYQDHIDQTRIYVTGFSVGGGIAILNAQRHPDWVAALVPTGAVVNRGQIADLGLLSVPSWFYHGDADPSVPHYSTNVFVNTLLDKGADTRLTTISGGDHHSAYHTAYASDAMWEWLFSQ